MFRFLSNKPQLATNVGSFLALSSLLFLAFTNVASAQATTTPTTFAGLVNVFLGLINILIPSVFAVVFIVIVWKIIDAWVIHGGDPTKRQEGRQLALIGVVVLVLMMVTWGVVALLRTTFFG